MHSLTKQLPRLTLILLAAFLFAILARGIIAPGVTGTTVWLIASAVTMFLCCWASAAHLLGPRAANLFVAIALPLGWFAEETGARFGWFFGSYHYTAVLGPRIGAVPAIIPLMWFALCYVAYILANLMVWQMPVDRIPPARWRLAHALVMAFLAAALVTAYDLGADPYMVFTLKAWIMTRTDGGWFGETLQGFVGWMVVAFAIVLLFRLAVRQRPPMPALPVMGRHTAVPLVIYAGSMLFQACLGTPVETRVIALFAMGIPLLAALCGWARWQVPALTTPAGAH
jgi:putative membrane protein